MLQNLLKGSFEYGSGTRLSQMHQAAKMLKHFNLWAITSLFEYQFKSYYSLSNSYSNWVCRLHHIILPICLLHELDVASTASLFLGSHVIVQLSKPMGTVAIVLAEPYHPALFKGTPGDGLPVALKFLRVDPKPVDSWSLRSATDLLIR